MTFTESNMRFDFSAFDSAEQYDSPENQCVGLKIVDFLAEDSGKQYFIEVKNYANTSDDPMIQAAMDRRQETDYRMLTDSDAAFPLEMGMKFKDSLLRWLASGKNFEKPIALLLVINPKEAMKPKARLKLVKRISGYIPTGMGAMPERYPRMNIIFFDMPTIEEVGELYSYSIDVTVNASETLHRGMNDD